MVEPGPPKDNHGAEGSAADDEMKITRSLLSIAYWHNREPGEDDWKRRTAVVASILLIVSLVLFKPPANASWIWWLSAVGRVVIVSYFIARYVIVPRS
jgi:hypothetical protein